MQRHSTTHEPSQNCYRRLLVMILLSFVSMYGLMYGMVNSFDNDYTTKVLLMRDFTLKTFSTSSMRVDAMNPPV